jgi:hypothetical protein
VGLVPRALDGLAVLDLATFVAAPFCCTLLGEFGGWPGASTSSPRTSGPARWNAGGSAGTTCEPSIRGW